MAEPFRVVFILYPRLTQLDFTGPYEVLARLPGAEIIIASKEGGTPASFRRSLMKRRSSNCLRVSIQVSPPAGHPGSVQRGSESRALWTNPRDAKQIMNGHYMFDMCSATP